MNYVRIPKARVGVLIGPKGEYKKNLEKRTGCVINVDSKKLHKPLIVHTRDAREDTIAILRAENAEQVGGVLHCFTETWQMAQQALELGFYISFSGIITFVAHFSASEIIKLTFSIFWVEQVGCKIMSRSNCG